MNELGALFVGIAALLGAAGSVLQSHRARKDAAKALATSPFGILESARAEIAALLRAYTDALTHHSDERQGMEKALASERQRAESAEAHNISLMGEVAGLRLDIAQAQLEIKELRGRVDALLADRRP